MASTDPPKRVLRKKGISLSDQDLKLLRECIQRRGKAVPGEMAQELGWARSSLAYNLNRLLKNGWIVRLGGGRSIRYRVTTDEEGRAIRQKVTAQENQARKEKQLKKMSLADRFMKFLAD
jgi:DNA-binding MarR family transcriptional regulator